MSGHSAETDAGLVGVVLDAYVAHLPKMGVRDMRQHCICGWKSDDTALVHRVHAAQEIARAVHESGYVLPPEVGEAQS